MKQLAILAFLVVLLAPGGRANAAAQGALCFGDVPGVANCIDGRMREYWEQNGGLPVFGYPLSAPHVEQLDGADYTVQYFERARFELHPENGKPYDVLLGQLGAALAPAGATPESGAQAGCLWFEQTKHNVCDQEKGIGFMSYWGSHGLLDPALDGYGRSLALFGLPLTDAHMERNATGANVLTQWFERARFEYVPGNQPEYRVLQGLLGVEFLAGQNTSGIAGDVTIGPVCAGPSRPGVCPDQPYAATILILDSKRNQVASVQSDADGHFMIALPPGDYILAPQSPGRFPASTEQTVAVVAGQITQVTIHYDTGIR